MRINAKDLKDEVLRTGYLDRAEALGARAEQREAEILALVERSLSVGVDPAPGGATAG